MSGALSRVFLQPKKINEGETQLQVVVFGKPKGGRNIGEQQAVRFSRDSLFGDKAAAAIAKQKPAHDRGACFSNLGEFLSDEFLRFRKADTHVPRAHTAKILSIVPPGIIHTQGKRDTQPMLHESQQGTNDGYRVIAGLSAVAPAAAAARSAKCFSRKCRCTRAPRFSRRSSS